MRLRSIIGSSAPLSLGSTTIWSSTIPSNLPNMVVGNETRTTPRDQFSRVGAVSPAPMPMFRGSAAAGLTAPAGRAIGRHDFHTQHLARDGADAVPGDVPGPARRQPRRQGAGLGPLGPGGAGHQGLGH